MCSVNYDLGRLIFVDRVVGLLCEWFGHDMSALGLWRGCTCQGLGTHPGSCSDSRYQFCGDRTLAAGNSLEAYSDCLCEFGLADAELFEELLQVFTGIDETNIGHLLFSLLIVGNFDVDCAGC